MKYLHLSDLHLLGSDRPNLYGADPRLRLLRALESMLIHHADADFIAVTGDLTNDGSPEAYRHLAEIAAELSLPLLPMVGNHDDREAFAAAFGEYLDEEGFVQYRRDLGDRSFLFLDTLVPGAPYGALCKDRLAWLEGELKQLRGREVHLLMHHHPIPFGYGTMDSKADFRSAGEFWEILGRFEGVRHIAFGHLHRNLFASHGGVTMHCTRSPVFQLAYLPEAPIEYLTIREAPAYGVVECDEQGVRVQWHEYLGEEDLFVGEE